MGVEATALELGGLIGGRRRGQLGVEHAAVAGEAATGGGDRNHDLVG